MNRHLALSIACVFALYDTTLAAQSVPLPSTTVQLTGTDMRAAVATAGSTSTLLSFTVEGDTVGDNWFDVATSNPNVAVSLVLPSGTEMTTGNAASLGFTFTTVAPGTNDNAEIPSVLSLPGVHTFIQIPGGQPSGTYQIKGNAAAVTSDSAIIATYFSSSTAMVAALADAANYKIGDTVVLSGLVFDGTTPVTGATLTATVSSDTGAIWRRNRRSFAKCRRYLANFFTKRAGTTNPAGMTGRVVLRGFGKPFQSSVATL